MSSWLITGGCGFIGSRLASRILDRFPADKIRIIDNMSVGTAEDLQDVIGHDRCRLVDIVEDDIRDPDAIKNAVQGGAITSFISPPIPVCGFRWNTPYSTET